MVKRLVVSIIIAVIVCVTCNQAVAYVTHNNVAIINHVAYITPTNEIGTVGEIYIVKINGIPVLPVLSIWQS